VAKNSLFDLEFVGDIEHEPTPFLRNDVGVHATTIVIGVEKISHIETKGDIA
jgi:hypothetical protein